MTVEGITIANSAGHAVSLSRSANPEFPDDLIRWVKIFTWRGNGDGVGSSGTYYDPYYYITRTVLRPGPQGTNELRIVSSGPRTTPRMLEGGE